MTEDERDARLLYRTKTSLFYRRSMSNDDMIQHVRAYIKENSCKFSAVNLGVYRKILLLFTGSGLVVEAD